jgi:hypothetical protein
MSVWQRQEIQEVLRRMNRLGLCLGALRVEDQPRGSRSSVLLVGLLNTASEVFANLSEPERVGRASLGWRGKLKHTLPKCERVGQIA